ncbi:MAG: NAD-dependent deacylase [Chloroflexi bacterium]|nr:NAD-dependent deacylase [Chloroflexota bacterium]MCC6892814.1 NAD-dependent deacylase [Anaerolineae bacterium]
MMTIQKCVDTLRSAKQISILTGAGVSKESGIPTFRDALDGLWARFDPRQLATPQAFQKDPKLVWDFYEYRRALMRPAEPNAGHFALAALQRRFPTLRIITQNVDDLHERAGSDDVIRLHGNIARNKCSADCQGSPTRVDVSQLTWDKASGPPPCPYCGRLVRPDVVWFGEMLPRDELDRALDLARRSDVMLVVGTSGMVSPSAEMPYLVKDHGGVVIEVNPETTPITRIATLHLQGASGVVLPEVVAALDTAQ